MEFYFVLGLITAAITVLVGVLFLKTRHVGFPVGIGLLYYWSLYGAWSVVTDRVGGDSGKRYDYLMLKMFPIDLDHDYMSALILYAGFILLVEVTVLFFLSGSPRPEYHPGGQSIVVSHTTHCVMAVFGMVTSFAIMADQLASATEMNLSAYVATRGGLGEYHPLFVVHQLLNRLAVFSLAIGLSVYLAGEQGVFLTSGRPFIVGLIYVVLGVGIFGFLAMLGNKNELFAGLILGGVLYVSNTRQVNWKSAIPIGVVAFLAIGSINFLRSLPVLALLDSETWWEAVIQAPEIRSSNEAFTAHFSLYGVLHSNAPLTYGASLIALAASVVPRLYWPDRPEGTYVKYAESLGIYEGPTGEAFTIHHATGWYLNFGMWGLIAGAILFGLIWGKCYQAHCRAKPGDRRWQNVLAIVAPAGLVSAIPLLVRAGPDVYKGLLIEAFIIPSAIVLFASIRWGKMFRVRNASPRVAIE